MVTGPTLDVVQATVFVALADWALRARRQDAGVFDALPHGAVTAVFAALVFIWINSIALATMAWANRRLWRAPWMVGAALLGVVVAKLFLVELAQVGTITRIVSFIGVGLLLLLIGYLAPVPPRKEVTP